MHNLLRLRLLEVCGFKWAAVDFHYMLDTVFNNGFNSLLFPVNATFSLVVCSHKHNWLCLQAGSRQGQIKKGWGAGGTTCHGGNTCLSATHLGQTAGLVLTRTAVCRVLDFPNWEKKLETDTHTPSPIAHWTPFYLFHSFFLWTPL